MKAIGLTGGLGMGKTTAADILAARGVPVVDTDVLARQLVEPGQPALDEIRAQFGSGVLDSSGCLHREALAQIVFADLKARQRLESILHPRIRGLWKRRIGVWESEGQPLAVVVIPLLFETGAETEVQATVCVACSAQTQRERLESRGWAVSQIEQRVAAQWPVEKKIARADYVVWTEGPIEVHEQQWTTLLAGWGQHKLETRSPKSEAKSKS